MGRSLSQSTFVAALALLTVEVASTGCSRKIEPDQTAVPPAASGAMPLTTATPTLSVPAAASAPTPIETARAAVDAGVEHAMPASPSVPPTKDSPAAPPQKKSGSAACGAQGCSPEMKKRAN